MRCSDPRLTLRLTTKVSVSPNTFRHQHMPSDISPSPRVVIIGSSCAGKSTLAKRLATAKACHRIELDELYWAEKWTPKSEAEFLRLVDVASAGQTWVAAGNYSAARGILWSRATTIIWLNYSLSTVLWRGVKRTVKRTITGEVLFHGNREDFRRAFLSRDSILWWIVSTYHRRRREFEALRISGEYAHLQWLEARSPSVAEKILRSLQNAI